jgi:hypothetical protein
MYHIIVALLQHTRSGSGGRASPGESRQEDCCLQDGVSKLATYMSRKSLALLIAYVIVALGTCVRGFARLGLGILTLGAAMARLLLPGKGEYHVAGARCPGVG